MQCHTCGRDTPDGLMVCRRCGAATRPSLLRRLRGWLRHSTPRVSVDVRTRVGPDEDPLGIEMPAAGAKAVALTVSEVPTRSDPLTGIDRLDPALRDKLLAAIAAGGREVKFERVVREEDGDVPVSETGTPVDPAVRAAIERLLESHPATPPGTSEQQIVADVDGTLQVYQPVDDPPPEVSKLLGRFAERKIEPDSNDG